MIVLRYYMPEAYTQGITEHPQKDLEHMGYKILKWEGAPIGDCVFVGVDKIIEPLPSYLSVSNWKFTYPDKQSVSGI